MSNPFAFLKFFKPSAYFSQDASLVTLFCLFIAGLSKILNFPNGELLVLFTMAVMSCAAAFPFGNQSSTRVGVTSLVVSLSITLGGYVGYHHLKLGQIIAVMLVGLAFYHPKNTRDSALWITSTMMFVIFLFFPVSLHTSILYGISSLVMGCLFALFYRIFKSIMLTPQGSKIPATSHHGTRALIGSSSMALGFLCVGWLEKHTQLTHITWVMLTIMMVIQGGHGKTLLTTAKRTGVNIIGAFVGVLLFTLILPSFFWLHFCVLVLLLFGIFWLGASYFWRVLCIELFVLGLAYLMDAFTPITAEDRIILTAIGCGIVVLVTSVSYGVMLSCKYFCVQKKVNEIGEL